MKTCIILKNYVKSVFEGENRERWKVFEVWRKWSRVENQQVLQHQPDKKKSWKIVENLE